MVLTSELAKVVYELLTASEVKDKDGIIQAIKEDRKDLGDSEAKLREAEGKLKQFEGVDVAELKSVKEFVDGKGGVDKLHEVFAKAEGYEADKQKIDDERKKFGEMQTKHTADLDAIQSQLKVEKLKNDIMPMFTDNFNGADKIMKLALDEGKVVRGDDGNAYVVEGDSKKSLSDGGIDVLKKSYEFAVKKPSGSGVPSNSPSNVNDHSNQSGSWWKSKQQ